MGTDSYVMLLEAGFLEGLETKTVFCTFGGVEACPV